MVKLLAVTMGDRYGVGPELVAGAVELLPRAPWLRIVVLGDREVFDRARAALALSLEYPVVLTLEAGRNANVPWAMMDRPFPAPVGPFGRGSLEAARESVDTLEWTAERLVRRRIDGLVYAPMDRDALAQAGIADGDETRILRRALKLSPPAGGAPKATSDTRVRLPLGIDEPIATTRGGVSHEVAGTGRAQPDELLAAIGVVVRMLDAEF